MELIHGFTYLDGCGRLDYGLAFIVVGRDLHLHTWVRGELVLRGRAGGGRGCHGDIWVGYMFTIVVNGMDGFPAVTARIYLDISIGNTGVENGCLSRSCLGIREEIEE